MHIIIDSRETKPLRFTSTKDCKITKEVRKLEYGDYACEVDGELLPVIFERKSKPDLWGTLTGGHARFKREIDRAKDDECKLILITECDYSDTRLGYSWYRKTKRGAKKYTHKYKGKSMVQQIHTLSIKYDLESVFCQNRTEMASYIRDYFIALEKNNE